MAAPKGRSCAGPSCTQTRLAGRLLVITTKSANAVRALAELARLGNAPVPIGEIASRRGLSPQFLESLFVTLRRGGVLQSQRGVKGGYSLARPAEEISALEVVEMLDGEVAVGGGRGRGEGGGGGPAPRPGAPFARRPRRGWGQSSRRRRSPTWRS